MAEGGEEGINTVSGITALCETISYYFNLRLTAKSRALEIPLPVAVGQIAELASSLKPPTTSDWAALAVGKLPPKTKIKQSSENGGDNKKSRGKWTEAGKEEMVKLVDDSEFRMQVLGERGTRLGHVNWSMLAERYNFSGVAPIYRQYKESTGRDPPGVKLKREKEEEKETGKAGGAAAEPESKRVKGKEVKQKAPETGQHDGWKKSECDELIKLVENESYRKNVTGKRHLKWSRIAEALKKEKKECKRKYTAVTGKEIPKD